MSDRARMFRKKMEVVAESPRSSRAGDRVLVSFVQRFRSGSYQDVGVKQLDLIVEDGALRITREEMLDSTREPPRPQMAATNQTTPEVPLPTDAELCRGTPDGWTVQRAPLDGGQAVWATRREPYYSTVAAVCRDGRLIARLDNPPDPSCGSSNWGGRRDRVLESDVLEVRAGVHAFAVIGGDEEPRFMPKPPRHSCEDDPSSDQEGFEPRQACENLQMFALVEGKLAVIYNDARARWVEPPECARFASALFQCTLARGKGSTQGWYDLEERCTSYEYGRAGSRSSTTRLRFSGGTYH
jgi:hypothetical protein